MEAHERHFVVRLVARADPALDLWRERVGGVGVVAAERGGGSGEAGFAGDMTGDREIREHAHRIESSLHLPARIMVERGGGILAPPGRLPVVIDKPEAMVDEVVGEPGDDASHLLLLLD